MRKILCDFVAIHNDNLNGVFSQLNSYYVMFLRVFLFEIAEKFNVKTNEAISN